jgi:hypothetical protein
MIVISNEFFLRRRCSSDISHPHNMNIYLQTILVKFDYRAVFFSNLIASTSHLSLDVVASAAKSPPKRRILDIDTQPPTPNLVFQQIFLRNNFWFIKLGQTLLQSPGFHNSFLQCFLSETYKHLGLNRQLQNQLNWMKILLLWRKVEDLQLERTTLVKFKYFARKLTKHKSQVVEENKRSRWGFRENLVFPQ